MQVVHHFGEVAHIQHLAADEAADEVLVLVVGRPADGLAIANH
ncbi:hypothetical protein ACFQZO_10230 [Bradyrhizobium sp. GCM10027634]|nr:hypothetical protein [Bradyrhizobium sp. WYCCWR 12677]MDN5001261.1 hypothetical protein [Bradyrhizobium sp. WYCCWR 12677]